MGSLGFEAALAVCPAAAQAYSKYCGIVSEYANANTREGLVELSRTIDAMEGMRDGIFGDIHKLMSVLELVRRASQGNYVFSILKCFSIYYADL
jgi:DCN1-like protein 1/2